MNLTVADLQRIYDDLVATDKLDSIPYDACTVSYPTHEQNVAHAMQAKQESALLRGDTDYYLPLNKWDETT